MLTYPTFKPGFLESGNGLFHHWLEAMGVKISKGNPVPSSRWPSADGVGQGYALLPDPDKAPQSPQDTSHIAHVHGGAARMLLRYKVYLCTSPQRAGRRACVHGEGWIMTFLSLTNRRLYGYSKTREWHQMKERKHFREKIVLSNISWISDSFLENWNSSLTVDYGV